MVELPTSLRLLLETPLEEELYEHWATLLETTLHNYTPPSPHLLTCMTIMVHPDFASSSNLRSTCHRVLLKTLERHGPKAFRKVLNFDSSEFGRHKRRKMRQSSGEHEEQMELSHLTDMLLPASESICIKFTSIWQLFGCAFSLTDGEAEAWLLLTDLLLEVIELDWQATQAMDMDLTKALLIQMLRMRNDRRVELKQILRYLLASPCEDYIIPSPYTGGDDDDVVGGQLAAETPAFAIAMSQKRRLLNLMFDMTQVKGLNVVLENELIATIANLMAPISIWTTFDSLSCSLHGTLGGYPRLVLTLCNSLLFRLAAFPPKFGKAGERVIDWTKVQGWCRSTSRSRDAVESVKVEFLKCTMLRSFLSGEDERITIDNQLAIKEGLLASLEGRKQEIISEPPEYSQTREAGKQDLPTTEELLSWLEKMQLELQMCITDIDT